MSIEQHPASHAGRVWMTLAMSILLGLCGLTALCTGEASLPYGKTSSQHLRVAGLHAYLCGATLCIWSVTLFRVSFLVRAGDSVEDIIFDGPTRPLLFASLVGFVYVAALFIGHG